MGRKPVSPMSLSRAMAGHGRVWFFWPRFIGVARFFVHHWESLTPENTARLVHSKNAASGNGVGVRETHHFVTRRLKAWIRIIGQMGGDSHELDSSS